MKVGDKLYCIKNVKTNINIQFFKVFTKNKQYEILDINDNIIEITSDLGTYLNITVEEIEKYFYTTKELRRNKLKNLNE